MLRSLLRTNNRGMGFILSILVMSIMCSLGGSLGSLTINRCGEFRRRRVRQELLFVAEAGIAHAVSQIKQDNFDPIISTAFPLGQTDTSYNVMVIDNRYSNDTYWVGAPGFIGKTGDVTLISTATNSKYGLQRRIQVVLSCNHPSSDFAIWVGNEEDTSYTLEFGGKWVGPVDHGDEILGDVFVKGDVEIAQFSTATVKDEQGINWGTILATNSVLNNGVNQGLIVENNGHEPIPISDILAMYYEIDSEVDLIDLFNKGGVAQGPFPTGHPLRDKAVLNPFDRKAEYDSTVGDDVFFENPDASYMGTEADLTLGEDVVYFVDGDVWFDKQQIRTFRLTSTRATIVAKGDIHIANSIEYEKGPPAGTDILALVAIKRNDGSGGDIYVGHEPFGLTNKVDACLYAAHDIKDENTNAPPMGSGAQEFHIRGILACANHLVLDRTNDPEQGEGRWKEDPVVRHSKIIVERDIRIKDPNFAPPGWPTGANEDRIVLRFKSWMELP